MKVKNHIREIETDNLKLVAIAWQDVEQYEDSEGGEHFQEVCRHEAYHGSEAEYAQWCEVGSVDTNCGCALCGKSLVYNCVVQHVDSGLFYDIGRDCCESIKSLKEALGWLDFKKANAAKRVAAGKAALAARKAGDIREAEYTIAKPEVAAALSYARAFSNNHALWHKVSWPITTLRDMRKKLRHYGSLSEKQETFALSLHKQAVERIAEAQHEVEARNKAIADGVRAPEGRQTVVGAIKSIKWKESDFGGAYKTLIELENGSRVYGTLPTDQHEQSFRTIDGWVTLQAEVGDKVEITATFEVSQKDNLFGFYKRPKFKNESLKNREAAIEKIETK